MPLDVAAHEPAHARSPSHVESRGRLAWGRSQVVALAVGLPVSGLLLYLTARKLDVASVVTALRSADPARVALAVAVIGCMYLVQALRWRWIARREVSLSIWRFLRYVVGGVALNNAVPGRPGDVLRAHWLGRGANISRANALGTVVVDRSTDLLTLVAVLALAFPLIGPQATWLRSLALATFAITVTSTLGVLLMFRFRRGVLDRMGGRLARLRLEAGNLFTTMRRSCDLIGLVGILIATCVAWTLWGLGEWLVAGSLGIGLSPLQIAFLTAVVNLGVAIPSSPGYVGTYQWLCVSALAVFGVPRSDAFAFSVISHAAWFVPSSLGGIALLAAKFMRGSGRFVDPAAADASAG